MLHEITLPDGSTRRMGNKRPPADKPRGTMREFGTSPDERLVPRGEWLDRLKEYPAGPSHSFLPPQKDQNGVGQCNPTAAATALEACRMQQGLPHVELSPADLYSRINGGVDEGSLLEDALSEMLARGVGTASTCGILWKQGYFKGQAGAAERNRFRFLEASLCPTFAHCFSAVLGGHFLVSGVPWFDNYAPDADGWLPPGRGNAGGHAIAGFKPASRGGQFGIWHRQSWGSSWSPATDNCFVIPESAYSQGGIGGWYAVRAVTDEGGVVPPEQLSEVI